eukprot:CCRYP_002565-RA/>CCRYP_002565-RA protein AED:0.07 eAED:0.07 QI:366/1/1/1/1/1/4/121/426
MSSILDYFTPITGIVGGCLIGLSAAVLLLFNGDILGASGLASSFVVAPRKTLIDPTQQWKLFFVGMFFLTTRIYVTIWPNALDDPRLGKPGIPLVSSAGYLVGGFFVGIGTRLGNGCTTGHGICGMARLSIRSFVGVGSFMLTGVLTATISSESGPIFRFLRDNSLDVAAYLPTLTSVIISSIIGSLIAAAGILGLILRKAPDSATQDENVELENNKRKILPSIASAFLFSVGLVVSQMTLFSKIYGFLNMKLIPDGTWDPTLLCVMGGGFCISFLSYQWVKGFNIFKNRHAMDCPLSQKAECGKFNVPSNKIIDINLIIGEVLFGFGWGTAGWCPGPAMFLAFAGYPYLVYRWWPMFFVGSFIGEQIKNLQTRLKERETSPTDDTGIQEETKQDINSKHDDTISNSTLDADKSDFDKNQVDLTVA